MQLLWSTTKQCSFLVCSDQIRRYIVMLCCIAGFAGDSSGKINLSNPTEPVRKFYEAMLPGTGSTQVII